VARPTEVGLSGQSAARLRIAQAGPRNAQRLATYMVISKPKRKSQAAGVVQVM
jgi:hypothetical protein